MSKFKTLIVEDQEGPLERLLTLLKKHPEVFDIEKMSIARSVLEAKKIILRGEKFEISILDKNLGDGTCFELIKLNRDSLGILVLNSQDTESQKYLKEISVVGSYYVIGKPYNETDIDELVVKLRLIKKSENITKDNVITLRSDGESIFIQKEKIIYVEVSDNYCWVCYKTDKLYRKMIKGQLKAFEEQLNLAIFFRISKKHIINLKFVKSEANGTITLTEWDEKNKAIYLPLPEKNKLAFLSRMTDI